MEEWISIPCGDIELDGLLDRGLYPHGVVVTHPHPLYGGDMYNPVVETIARTYRANGWATLRFNFRGTGRSGGEHDNGDGEQDDVAAALNFMVAADIENLDLAGYSFGAWVCARGADRFDTVDRMVMVAPPVAFLNFDGISHIDTLRLVVTGSEDELAPPNLIRNRLPAWNRNALFLEIEGADHFFFGSGRDLEAALLKGI